MVWLGKFVSQSKSAITQSKPAQYYIKKGSFYVIRTINKVGI